MTFCLVTQQLKVLKTHLLTSKDIVLYCSTLCEESIHFRRGCDVTSSLTLKGQQLVGKACISKWSYGNSRWVLTWILSNLIENGWIYTPFLLNSCLLDLIKESINLFLNSLHWKVRLMHHPVHLKTYGARKVSRHTFVNAPEKTLCVHTISLWILHRHTNYEEHEMTRIWISIDLQSFNCLKEEKYKVSVCKIARIIVHEPNLGIAFQY